MSGISPTKYTFSADNKRLPAGEYMVIDPCYIIGGDPFWGEFCDFLYSGERENKGGSVYITINGHHIFSWNTAYGDGVYPATDGNTMGDCGVDAGLLCLFPMRLIDELYPDDEKERDRLFELGTVLDLDVASTPEVENGDLTCGNIEVNTSGGMEEEDDEEEEEEEEEEEQVEEEDDKTFG